MIPSASFPSMPIRVFSISQMRLPCVFVMHLTIIPSKKPISLRRADISGLDRRCRMRTLLPAGVSDRRMVVWLDMVTGTYFLHREQIPNIWSV